MTVDNNDYNKGGYIAFIFCIVFSFVFFFYISFLHPGVNIKEVDENLLKGAEQTMAEGESAPKKVDVSGVSDPWNSSEDLVAHGQSVYKSNCAVCHGDSGLGDGPAGKALVPPPRNLVEGNWKVGGDRIALFKTVANGISGTSMAAFGHLPKVDRWALVHYIRSITKNKEKADDAKVADFGKTAE